MGLRHGDAGAVRDQQVHHRVAGHVHGRRRHHAAEGHGAGGGHAGVDRADHHRLAARVGAHVALQLRGRLAVDAAQVADEHAARGRAAEAAGAVLPLLAVVLLGVDAQVRQRGEAWWRRRKDTERKYKRSHGNNCGFFPSQKTPWLFNWNSMTSIVNVSLSDKKNMSGNKHQRQETLIENDSRLNHLSQHEN